MFRMPPHRGWLVGKLTSGVGRGEDPCAQSFRHLDQFRGGSGLGNPVANNNDGV